MGFLRWLLGIKDKPTNTDNKTIPVRATTKPNVASKGSNKPPAYKTKPKRKTVTRTSTRTVYFYDNNNYYYDYDGCLIDSLGNLIEDVILLESIMNNDNIVPDYEFPQEIIYEQPIQDRPIAEPLFSDECYPYTPPEETKEPIPDSVLNSGAFSGQCYSQTQVEESSQQVEVTPQQEEVEVTSPQQDDDNDDDDDIFGTPFI